uniref:SET domain-containing protein n=2 Tax=Pseudo-nitzschia australis TaxID=44445 RepID=A0A7S4AQB4_9STRA|mmetsp:Transcript_88/g.233  ORF Transcript_88/g.233 Transcript_88/m.233 type:complete len:465 (+) Transcript_88:146-1540(+)
MSVNKFGTRHGIMVCHRRRSLAITPQICFLLLWSTISTCTTAFSINGLLDPSLHRLKVRSPQSDIDGIFSSNSMLHMAKTAKKKKTKKKGSSGSSSSGLKGFGSIGATKDTQVDLDRSKEARLFYDFMEGGSASDNLSRCAIGSFPLGDDFKLRGIAALKPVKKGDSIIRIPYELAINLGQEGVDPTAPAVAFLKDYCETLASAENSNDTPSKSTKAAYYSMLPPFEGDDCLGSTDFFSDQALNELQAPLVIEETKKRKQRTSARFQSDVAPNLESFPKWIDGSSVTEDHLAWAVWLVTSRVLTVQGDAEEGKSYRLLIPFLDMCNHDRGSSHVLSGRAVPGGELKVVAGASVKEGDQINICYGGGMVGNDRFIQDYGFLDTSDNNRAYDMVAQQLLGKRRIVEGVGAGGFMSESDRKKTLDQLKQTTIQEDENLLKGEKDTSLVAAYNYRIGVKKALSKFGSD